MIRQVTIILAFLMMLSSPVAAQGLQKGLAAYNAGNEGSIPLTCFNPKSAVTTL